MEKWLWTHGFPAFQCLELDWGGGREGLEFRECSPLEFRGCPLGALGILGMCRGKAAGSRGSQEFFIL